MKECRLEMPEVVACGTDVCVYNVAGTCRARAITVGDLGGHVCDTRFEFNRHTKRAEHAGVGACRAMQCKHNVDFECQAETITIRYAMGQADCVTFARA